jgi:hypothetical protein
MPSFIVARFCIFLMIFQVVFEVSLLVEVRLRASLSAPRRTPVANGALAYFSSSVLFVLRQQQNSNAVTSLCVQYEFIVLLLCSRFLPFRV